MTDTLCLLLLIVAVGVVAYAVSSRKKLADMDRKYRRECITSTNLKREASELSIRLEEANRNLTQCRKRASENIKPYADRE